MARTLNGNLTGRAARTYLSDLISSDPKLSDFAIRFQDAVDTLREIDPDEWEAWYDERPEQTKGEMLPLMEARIDEIKKKQKRIIMISRQIDGMAEIQVDPASARAEWNIITARLAEDPLTDEEAENLKARLVWLDRIISENVPY